MWVSRYSGGWTPDGETLRTPYARGAVPDIFLGSERIHRHNQSNNFNIPNIERHTAGEKSPLNRETVS